FFRASPAVFDACFKQNLPVVFTIHNYRLICANALLLRNGVPCELCTHKKFALAGIRYKCYHNSAIESAIVTTITGYHKLMGTWKNKISRYIVLTEFARRKILNSSVSVTEDKIEIIPNFIPDIGTTEYNN